MHAHTCTYTHTHTHILCLCVSMILGIIRDYVPNCVNRAAIFDGCGLCSHWGTNWGSVHNLDERRSSNIYDRKFLYQSILSSMWPPPKRNFRFVTNVSQNRKNEIRRRNFYCEFAAQYGSLQCRAYDLHTHTQPFLSNSIQSWNLCTKFWSQRNKAIIPDDIFTSSILKKKLIKLYHGEYPFVTLINFERRGWRRQYSEERLDIHSSLSTVKR